MAINNRAIAVGSGTVALAALPPPGGILPKLSFHRT